MRHGLRFLAVVPARSGSKGIPHKNLQPIAGKSLIGWAAATLSAPENQWIDRAVISTDSPEYAAEAQRHGLAAPFLRPAELSSDNAGAVETMQHAVREMEQREGCRYDAALIVEPTSPFRLPADLAACVDLLVKENADSVVTVSSVNPKYHSQPTHRRASVLSNPSGFSIITSLTFLQLLFDFSEHFANARCA